MKIFLVVKKGVYIQEIVFVCSHKLVAAEQAVFHIKKEHDDYHCFSLYEAVLNSKGAKTIELASLKRKGKQHYWEEKE